MAKFKKTVALLLALAVAFVFTGCTTYDNFKNAFFGDGKKADTVIFGVLEPQSGDDAPYGKEEIKGIELAHEMYPEVLGKKIDLIYEDTQSSIYTSKTAAEELIVYEPALILGCYGNANALAAASPIEEAKVPTIGISVTNNLITDNHHFFASMTFNDTIQGKALGKYVAQKLKSKNVAIFRQNDDDSTLEVTNRFISEARNNSKNKKNGTTICTKQYFQIDETDYTSYLQKIRKSLADTVFCPVGVEVADQLFTQVEDMMMTDITFVGTNLWYNDDFLKMMKNHPKIKVIVASDFTAKNADSKASERFITAYQEKYGKDEIPSEQAALAFDGYMLAIAAIEKAGTFTSEEVMQAILDTEGFVGATGDISMDSNGRPDKPITISKIKNGKFVAITKVKANEKKDKTKKKSKKKTKKKGN